MNTKSKNTSIIIYAVIAVLYLVCFFAIPFEKNAITWTAFAFGFVSIIGGAIAAFVSFENGQELKSKIYGFPIFRLGYYYTIVQLILTVIFCTAGSFIELPVWIVVVSGAILLGVFIIGVISVDRVREVVERQDISDAINTKTVETFRLDIDSLVRKSPDANVQRAMEKLAEEFKYSDPMSSEATRGIEEEIKGKIEELASALVSDPGRSMGIIDEVRGLLENRNRVCRSSK